MRSGTASSESPTAPAAAATSAQQWDGRSRGGDWLFAICAWLLPFVGFRGMWIGSWIIGAGFMLFGGRWQYGSLRYWRHVRPRAGVIVHLMLSIRRYASFGRVLCDRLMVYLHPERYRFDYNDQEMMRSAVADRRGCILLAAHLGNWELSGFRLQKMAKRRIHLVMVRDDHPYAQRFVDAHMRHGDIKVIDPRDPLGASLAIHAALANGETVCMLGDRIFGNQPETRARFFGESARFPIGPFHAAAIAGVPIHVCFLVKTSERSYRVELDPPWHVTLPPRGPARKQAMQALVQQWADRLEDQVRRYPLQWHNFYDFWL